MLKGAKFNPATPAKSLSAGLLKIRNKLIDEGKVTDWVTTEDLLFSSSSAAAEVILGYGASGPMTWKASDGRTLREIEQGEAEEK